MKNTSLRMPKLLAMNESNSYQMLSQILTTKITGDDTDVLIVGASPTGLTLACELLRRGVSCRIIDKGPTPATTSRALGLQPRTLELFDTMGLIDVRCGKPWGFCLKAVRMRKSFSWLM